MSNSFMEHVIIIILDIMVILLWKNIWDARVKSFPKNKKLDFPNFWYWYLWGQKDFFLAIVNNLLIITLLGNIFMLIVKIIKEIFAI